MTDSLKITLDLKKLPLHARRKVPLRFGMDFDQMWKPLARGLRPTKQFSPMSGTKMKWVVGAQNLLVEDEWVDVATVIHADLNLPNALVGQNLEHGTSVFAAGVAAFWLLKIWLARAGVDRLSLDKLGLADVLLRSVTLTYLIECLTEAEAQALVDDLCLTVKILSSRAETYESTNKTLKMPTSAGALGAYLKTLLKYCKFLEGAPTAGIMGANRKIVRLESKISAAYLGKVGMTSLLSWRDAYAEGLYELFCEKTVLEPLHLDLRHNRPRPEAMNRLTPMERQFVEFYLAAGKPQDFPNVAGSAFPTQTLSKLRTAVRKKLKIDTDIPWTKHQELRCFTLKDRLQYPGDYCPPTDRAAWCFCRESWPATLQRLQDCFEHEMELHEWGAGPGAVAVAERA
jgi:hypothetical protein